MYSQRLWKAKFESFDYLLAYGSRIISHPRMYVFLESFILYH